MTRAIRVAVPLLVLVLAVVAGVVVFGGGSDQKTLTALFPRTVSLYEGSDVRVLGVPIGKVDEVTPKGELVEVVMTYDGEVDIPSDAKAVIISPAIVGDRYVQLTPVFQKGDKALEDDTVLDEGRTAVPLELDEIYASLNELNVALGPNGANKNGALTDLLEVTAENFGGQGEQFNTTIRNFSRLTKTLDDNKEELFGSARALSRFIETLAENDGTVRAFNRSLGRVSTVLADERQELASALRNLGIAVGEVGILRARQPRGARQGHPRPQPGARGAGAPAELARRGAAHRAGGAQQPGAHLQPRRGHARHQLQRVQVRGEDREQPEGRALRARRRQRPERRPVRHHPGAAAAPRSGAARRRQRLGVRRVRPHARRPRGGEPVTTVTTPRPRRQATAASRALLIALLGCLLLSGCDFDVYKLPLPGGADTGEDPIDITVEFADVLDLVPKSSVKVKDVTVGQISDIDLDDETNTAKVKIELRSDTELPANADRRDPADQPAGREVRRPLAGAPPTPRRCWRTVT